MYRWPRYVYTPEDQADGISDVLLPGVAAQCWSPPPFLPAVSIQPYARSWLSGYLAAFPYHTPPSVTLVFTIMSSCPLTRCVPSFLLLASCSHSLAQIICMAPFPHRTLLLMTDYLWLNPLDSHLSCHSTSPCCVGPFFWHLHPWFLATFCCLPLFPPCPSL